MIVATDMTGLRLLGGRDRNELVGRSIAEVFDTSFEELVVTSNSGRRAMWELRDNFHGRRYYACMMPADQQGRRSSTKPSADAGRVIVHVAPRGAQGVLTLADLAGEDPKMIRNLRNARRVADRAVSVIIGGPTGSGKEAFAKALHLFSSRSQRPFIAINCGAIPESLIESELFGYAAGAFTGARRDGMRGRIAQSSGGTLFLDEIGDMPLLLQTRLLRALEEQEVTPLGGDAPLKVDLRVVCASHRDLRKLVATGEFREDLYYRLNGITLDLPPLCARRDLETLIRQCIARESAGNAAAIEMIALQRLLEYNWPGNIRELRNVIRTALALCDDGIIRLSDLPAEVGDFSKRALPGPSRMAVDEQQKAVSFASAEREALLRVIEQHRWVMSRVAAHFGVSRNTLYRKIKRHGISLVRST
jgi:transcriptional regulator of acetoin/glycerol metabolism